jgi:hypothetical protein
MLAISGTRKRALVVLCTESDGWSVFDASHGSDFHSNFFASRFQCLQRKRQRTPQNRGTPMTNPFKTALGTELTASL